jgi:hypothetical protein
MIYAYIVLSLATIAASFVAGALWGRNQERKATTYLRSVLDSVDNKFKS